MDLENKVIGFQFVPERSICNHKGFYQDSGDKVMLWSETCLTGKKVALVLGSIAKIAPQ